MSEDQKAEAKSEREVALENKEKELAEINGKREGKGVRLRVGQTRGKNPQIVVWEAFDLAQPATLPGSLTEFMDLTKTTDETLIVGYLLDGYNDAMYTAASDPIAEYVEASWPEEIQKNFRVAVRNYSTAVGCSIEDSVALIKPGIVKSQLPKA
jgi:hypothetical protein